MENKELILILIFITVFIFLGSSFGMMGFWGYGRGSMMQGVFSGSNSFGFFGIFFCTLIFIAIVLFIFWLIKGLQDTKGRKK